MEKLSDIISETTKEVIGTLKKDDRDWLAIEQKVMSAVNDKITEHNKFAKAYGEPKLQVPDHLSATQVANIISAVMTIRVTENNGKKALEILENGSYKIGDTIIMKAATSLSSNMGKKSLDKIINRLMLIYNGL